MKLPYVFHPLAATELDEAVEYNESLRPGMGVDLLVAAQRAILHACRFPEAAPVIRGSIRSKLLTPSRRWPYGVHYSVGGGTLRILAFAHQSRQPFYWLGRQ